MPLDSSMFAVHTVSQMRKIAFIAANENLWGGSEVLWSRAAEKMAGAGAEVRVSTPGFAGSSDVVKRLRSAGAQISYRRIPPFAMRMARRFFLLPEYRTQHVRQLADGVDLVVISQGTLGDGLSWIEAARDEGLKYVIIVQGASEFMWPADYIAERLADGFEHATRAYFVSEATRNLCRRQLGTPLRHGRVVRNPFNVRYDTPLPWPNGSADELSFACVGRLELVTKGHDLLLQVLSHPRWRERDVQLHFIGSGPHERAVRRLAEELRVENVHFAGQQNDIEEVWAKNHALVLPSRAEGMPLVVVEAMLCGRPCVATDVGGSRELIRDGVNGFLAKCATVELLDEAMNRAWEGRGRLREMGEAAAKDVRQWVSADPIGDFVRELDGLVDERAC